MLVGSPFVDEDEVLLHSRDANGNIYTYYSIGEGMAREIPMTVLVNEASASSAEIIAGALQENGRAQLIGETTLGTGTVLRPFELSDGSVIRLGVTNWLTPEKNLIKGKGVEPNVAIDQSPSVQMIDSIELQDMTRSELYNHKDHQFSSALLNLRMLILKQARETTTTP